jgi:hypothetical protein
MKHTKRRRELNRGARKKEQKERYIEREGERAKYSSWLAGGALTSPSGLKVGFLAFERKVVIFMIFVRDHTARQKSGKRREKSRRQTDRLTDRSRCCTPVRYQRFPYFPLFNLISPFSYVF